MVASRTGQQLPERNSLFLALFRVYKEKDFLSEIQ
jgi:hypothetical protein